MLRKKSLLALLLSLCMVVGILPTTVFAAGAGMPKTYDGQRALKAWYSGTRPRAAASINTSFG